MKKIFIGLLVIAAGTAVYFLLIKKEKDPVANSLNKEWIIGKWRPAVQQPVTDPATPAFRYDFQKDGLALRSVSDTAKADTLHYSWQNTAELLLKTNPSDTSGTVFTVARLSSDSLEIKGTDNAILLFTKVK